jgi:hypothetical protein
MAIDWTVVNHTRERKPIGAVGFLNDGIVAMVAFYADNDWDHDGKIDLKERFLLPMMTSMKGKAIAEVALHAYQDPDIAIRDPSISQWRGDLLGKWASNMVFDGVYKTYLAYGVSRATGAIAGQITQNSIKAYVIKKGMEKAVKEAYEKSVGI